jgi:hypothetical protein
VFPIVVIVIQHSWPTKDTTGPCLAARGERRGGAFRIDATTVDRRGRARNLNFRTENHQASAIQQLGSIRSRHGPNVPPTGPCLVARDERRGGAFHIDTTSAVNDGTVFSCTGRKEGRGLSHRRHNSLQTRQGTEFEFPYRKPSCVVNTRAWIKSYTTWT